MIEVDPRAEQPQRREWAVPKLERLPKLTSLTLVTIAGGGDVIDGEGDTTLGGSTVF